MNALAILLTLSFIGAVGGGGERKKERVAYMAAAVAGEVLLIVNERFREMAT